MANTQEKGDVIPFDASILIEDADASLKNMTQDDLLIPRLKILQAQSPEVNKADGGYVKGAEAGHIYDNVSGNITDGSKGLTVVPVSYRKTFIEWTAERKLVADHGLEPANIDQFEQNEKGALINDKNKNSLSLTAEYFVYVIEDDDTFSPAIVSMSSSGLKKSKRWNSMINRLQIPHPAGKGTINPAMFWTAYVLKTVPEQNDFGSWFNWEVEMKYDAKSGGILKQLPNGQDLYLEAREFSKKVKTGDVKVSPDSPADEDAM